MSIFSSNAGPSKSSDNVGNIITKFNSAMLEIRIHIYISSFHSLIPFHILEVAITIRIMDD